MRTPQLYDAGKHLLQLGATVNGKLVQQFSKEITVPPKPARLQVTALDAPPYVYAEQQIVLRATVKNVGSLPAVSEGLSIEVDGVPVSTQQVDLGPGASEVISCAYAVPASGDSFHVQSLQASAKMSLLKPFSTDQDLADGSGLETIGSPHTVAGKRGQALKLDGESDYLKISPIDLSSRPFTLTAWIRVDEFIQPHDEFPVFSGGVKERNKGLHVGVRMKKPWFGCYANDSIGGTELAAGKWHFLAFVQQAQHHEAQTGPSKAKDSGTLQKAYWTAKQEIYVNGVLDAVRECQPYLATLDYIGTFWGDAQSNGAVDDVRVYQKALTDDQVQSLFQDNRAIQAKPALWLSFD